MSDGIMKKLHEDVVIHILLELPVKSLMRFKSISKILYTLIHSSIFINLHHNRSTTTKDELFILKLSLKIDVNLYKDMLSFLSCNDDDTINNVCPDMDVPHSTRDFYCGSQQLLGPCHGLIAVTNFEHIVILNPATRKHRLLPSSPFVCPSDFIYLTRVVGFGYDSVEIDYKVVRFYELSSEPYDRDIDATHSVVEVYDFCTDAWRFVTITVQLLPRVHQYPNCQVLYRDTFHWTSFDEGVRMVLCFNLSTETFRNIVMPSTCYFCDNKGYGLAVFQNSLALICYPHPKCPIEYPGQEITDIWLIKEYGVDETWIKIYAIRPLPIVSSLALWKEYVLLFQTGTGTLSSYDVNTEEVKEFDVQAGILSTLTLLVYKEALTIIPRESKDGTEVQNFWSWDETQTTSS